MKRHHESTVMIDHDRKHRDRDHQRGRDRDRDRDDADNDEQEPRWRRFLSLTFTIAVVAATLYLWPAMLGGSTRLVIVSGRSMEPTYDLLDIVVARDGGNTQVGDVVVFEVPEGEAEGMLVIHRVLEVDDEGFFVTQGDNRDTPDQWQLTEDDIVGKPLAHIPKGGKALGFIQNIWVIALLVGLVVLFALWPDEEDTEEEDAEDTSGGPAHNPELETEQDTEALERDPAWVLVDTPMVTDMVATETASVDECADDWLKQQLGQPIDEHIMADAVAWLDAELDRFKAFAGR